MLPLKVDYYLDALSQWCYISDRAILRVRMRYGNRLAVNYHFVPISGRDPIYVDAAAQRLAYERSEFITGVHTTPWLRDEPRSTWDANAAIVAVASMGIDVERARSCVSCAALERGLPLGDRGEAASLLAAEFGLERSRIEEIAQSQAICNALDASAAEFAQHGLTVRPAFILENEIGDRIILNGGWRESLLGEAVDSLLADAAGYEWYEKHIHTTASRWSA